MKLPQAGKNRRKMLWLTVSIGALAIAASLVVTAAVAWQFYSIRTAVRWPAWSVRYKSEVLAQSNTTGKLKHIEWDGWGWAGQDTTVYLVFDPTDSLLIPAHNHRPGKFDGIPCEVPAVKQLEKNWYLVQFYTNEWWGRRNALDCTGSGD